MVNIIYQFSTSLSKFDISWIFTTKDKNQDARILIT